MILLEAALQPCGWMAAYLGAALTSPTDLCFRNLGGKARVVRRSARRRHSTMWPWSFGESVRLSSRVAEDGSEMPSLYADPSPNLAAEVLRSLETPVLGTLADSYVMRVPIGLLFTTTAVLTPAGTLLLHAVAQNIRHLPYDLRFGGQLDRDAAGHFHLPTSSPRKRGSPRVAL